jgi:eight-cysteine-cluster-containing protein
MAKKIASGPKGRKGEQSLRNQFKENKQLLLGVFGAILMLLFASFGARSDFFKTKMQSKPVPDELVKSLTPTPKNSDKSRVEECIITGCSGQVCASEEVITSCVAKEIYSCYKTATCEVQADGECGWTMDGQLSKCLQSFVGEPSI